MLDSI